jgi:glycosyltransferase involved in cell wall biosynthesis
MQPSNVSVILTTYNQPRLLEIALAALRGQTVTGFEVVIGDDGSDGRTRELLDRLSTSAPPFALKHYWQPDEGFRAGEARNGAVRMASGDWLIFIDGDLAVHPRFVEAHLRRAGPGRVLFGGRLKLNREFSEHVSPREVLERGIDSLVTDRFRTCREEAYAPVTEGLGEAFGGKLVQRFAGRPRPFWNSALNALSRVTSRRLFQRICFKSGSNFSTGRALVERVNGFDRRFRNLSGEDGEFFWRLFHAGAAPRSVLFTAVAYHLWHPENWERAGEQRRRSLELERQTRVSGRFRCEDGLAEGVS